LQLETKVVKAEEKEITEKEFLKWARAQPGLERKLWPDREQLTPEEKRQRMREILRISEPKDPGAPGNGSSGTMVEALEPAGKVDSGSTANQGENPTTSG
jgi:hypothetical protein